MLSNHFFQAILSEQLAHLVTGFPDAVRADEQDLTVLDGDGRLPKAGLCLSDR